MATLILTAVGTVVGGPIGGAIGAIAGQAIDSAIFAPKARQGPRLADLKVQTSTYGAAIPKLFGRTRVAGTVIWATDLIESRSSQSNGKGRPRTETYSYSASFAVALSARPIAGVGRIWADGKLLRGEAGDFKSATGFRLHLGDEGQALDPLIAAAQGIGTTPAYRGIAYAVFDAMALGEFGNRIPSLSFEVIADPEPRRAGDIVVELAGDGASSDGGPPLTGLAASGDSVRSVAETLGISMPFATIDGLRLRFGAAPLRVFDLDDLGVGEAPRVSSDRDAASVVPDALLLNHADPARDYQEGSQRASRGTGARRTARIELPAAVEADVAKGIAETRLRRFEAERARAKVALPWRALDIAPGDQVVLPGQAGRYRVAKAAFEAMAVKLELVRVATPSGAVAADAGTTVSQPDLPHGATTLFVLDLPQIDDAPASAPLLVVAANGVSSGWRGAPLLASADGGATYDALGKTALPATIGVATTALAARPAELIDMVSTIDVTLINASIMLSDADEARLTAGANLAMIGNELVQFGRAQWLGGSDWRLSALWRGRRATEWATGGHAAGERFVLVERDALFAIPEARAIAGLRVLAAGLGDGEGTMAMGPTDVGAALRPPSPVGLIARANDGDTEILWKRRSRDGWRWRDAIDVPIGEERERYRIEKRIGALVTTDESDVAHWTYTGAMRAADAATGATTATFAISQMGSLGVSRAATIVLTL